MSIKKTFLIRDRKSKVYDPWSYLYSFDFSSHLALQHLNDVPSFIGSSAESYIDEIVDAFEEELYNIVFHGKRIKKYSLKDFL